MDQDTATQVFVDHRELLFSIVYNMSGSVADTEDVLQETWLSWAAADRDRVENPRAYLVRIAVNQALARRAALSRRRETYVGQWLPEPVVTDAMDPVARAESSSMALLVVLETLSPAERAVFVLHEAFGYRHRDIAEMLDRSPETVRQLAHRAREHVRARRPRYRVDARVQQAVTERFVAAALGGDLQELLRILAPDVTLWTDGGGKGPATSLQPVHGSVAVAQLLVAVAANVPEPAVVRYRRVNGDPSALVFTDDSPLAVLVLDLTPDGDRVCGVYSVTNPDKLVRIPRGSAL
ncbi:RNA polymerase sigma-70 factor, ECF subfamily [Micromonospora viridifaciens]|uniref:RNA polymerase sigma-70 factor, ECF subfamily n=1 Tax=Micromonospora viridifaciens TaxID=1881 RepID=A0A1C4ZA72_MICVI|nr:RNA polymerase sigma factor SigJ [Micromonospora viridifaciens]SCF29855.1 RNA polymerase sigma-70 factor, ECF subfamily [Micromonospora viridifaciens]